MSTIDQDLKTVVVKSILSYLKDEWNSCDYDDEQKEGLEVAIQCIANVYNINESSSSDVPVLLELFKKCQITPEITPQQKERAEQLKVMGNDAMTEENYVNALECYSKAIEIDGKNPVYYCNRAAAYSRLENHKSAIEDCQKAIELSPRYSKAYGRMGLAYSGLEDYVTAIQYYKKAMEIEPENEGYHKNYLIAKSKLESRQTTAPNGFDMSTVFSNPALMNAALELISDPQMGNLMNSLLTSSENSPLFRAGQLFSQELNNRNPDLVNNLRQQLNRLAEPQESQRNSTDDSNNSNNDNSDGGTGDPNHQHYS